MLNVPASIRNEIAATGLMTSQTLARIFRMKDEDAADRALDALAEKAVGDDPLEKLAYLTVMPLLQENVAISRWISAGNPQMRSLLPEVLTVGEAVTIAQADFLLSARQTARLSERLSTPLP